MYMKVVTESGTNLFLTTEYNIFLDSLDNCVSFIPRNDNNGLKCTVMDKDAIIDNIEIITEVEAAKYMNKLIDDWDK